MWSISISSISPSVTNPRSLWAFAVQVGIGKGFQAPAQLLSRQFDEAKVLFQVALSVIQRCRELRFIVANEQRLVLGDDPFDPVRPGLFRIGKVTDDFVRTPFAGDRPREELLPRHAGDRGTDVSRSGEIALDKLTKCGHAADPPD